MKTIYIVWTVFSSTFALKGQSSGFLFNTNEENLDIIVKEVAQFKGGVPEFGDGGGGVTAIVNEFADRLLANIETLAEGNGFDPMPIDGFDGNFLVARVTLSNGSLKGISTISRNGDTVASYQLSTHILNLKVPIKFDHIGFEYKFYVLLLLFGHSGKLTGNIDSVKAYVELSFDFNVYQAKLNQFSMRDTGHISIHVEGGIIEAVLNILSELVTTIIHPLIIGVIQAVVKLVLNSVIDFVNSGINDILHPNDTSINF